MANSDNISSSGILNSVRGVIIVFCLISTSAARWTSDPTILKTSLTLSWDDTGVDNSFVKFVVQLYRSKGRNCSDVYRPAMVQELPVYVWRQATFTATDRTGRFFNSVSVTNTSITVTWPSFTEQRESGHLNITIFFYYMLDIMPGEIETKRPQMFYNETELEATFDALTPGKEYEIKLTLNLALPRSRANHAKLEKVATAHIKKVYNYNCACPVSKVKALKGGRPFVNKAGCETYSSVQTRKFFLCSRRADVEGIRADEEDPSPVEEVSVITTDSTSVTFNLTPPKEGFVDLFQIQATSPHHTSPLVDVPFPDETLTSVRTTLSNLQPETTYNLSATAVAKGRTGQAKVVTFITEAVPVDPTLVGSVTTALVVTLIAAAFCTVWIVRRRKYKLDPAQLFKEVLEDIVGSEKMEPWLKNRKDLFLEELIGEGEFGHVRKGVLREDGQQAVIVAAKTLRISFSVNFTLLFLESVVNNQTSVVGSSTCVECGSPKTWDLHLTSYPRDIPNQSSADLERQEPRSLTGSVRVTAAARSRPGIQPTVLYTMKGPHKYYLYGALPGTVYLVLDTR
ncbi:hypothetical protein Bbelb_055140 [Branchiostoma belcheri]|nr:hypothetical protein Bbelb_055140 [Branchiostoma belcheri]